MWKSCLILLSCVFIVLGAVADDEIEIIKSANGISLVVGMIEVALIIVPIFVAQQRKIGTAIKIVVIALSILNLIYSVWSCCAAIAEFDLMLFGFISLILWLPPLIIAAVAPRDRLEGEQASSQRTNTDPQIDALERLARLKENGLLSDEEFALKKKQILQQD